MSLQFLSNILNRDLAEQVKHLETQQQSGKLRRFLDAGQDIEGLERCYRRIEMSFHQLQVRNKFSQAGMSTE